MRVLIQTALCKPSVVTHTVIPALEKQRQEDYEFEASLGYIVRSVSKTKSKEKSIQKARSGYTSVVQHLPSKYKALGFITNNHKWERDSGTQITENKYQARCGGRSAGVLPGLHSKILPPPP